MINLRIALLIALMLGAPVAGAADTVYKWTSEDGSVVFSDELPESKSDQAETVELREPDFIGDPASNVTPQAPVKLPESLATQRIRQREELQQQLVKYSDELAVAKQAYEDGKTPREGEIQRLAGGRSKLSQAYFARLKKEEQQLEFLETKVAEIHEALQKLR